MLVFIKSLNFAYLKLGSPFNLDHVSAPGSEMFARFDIMGREFHWTAGRLVQLADRLGAPITNSATEAGRPAYVAGTPALVPNPSYENVNLLIASAPKVRTPERRSVGGAESPWQAIL